MGGGEPLAVLARDVGAVLGPDAHGAAGPRHGHVLLHVVADVDHLGAVEVEDRDCGDERAQALPPRRLRCGVSSGRQLAQHLRAGDAIGRQRHVARGASLLRMPHDEDDVAYTIAQIGGRAVAWLDKGSEGHFKGEANKRDGFVDADGWFWFVGRADDVIKSAGHLIGPFEVESALMEHSAVAEAGVIGKPDAMAGESVKAFVVLKREAMADTLNIRPRTVDRHWAFARAWLYQELTEPVEPRMDADKHGFFYWVTVKLK